MTNLLREENRSPLLTSVFSPHTQPSRSDPEFKYSQRIPRQYIIYQGLILNLNILNRFTTPNVSTSTVPNTLKANVKIFADVKMFAGDWYDRPQ